MQRSKIIITAVVLVLVFSSVAWYMIRLNSDASDQNTETSPTPVQSVVYRGQLDKTVLDLLRVNAVVETASPTLLIVTGINGVKNSSTHYWTFYVNGKQQAVERASLYLTGTQDEIEWRYIRLGE